MSTRLAVRACTAGLLGMTSLGVVPPATARDTVATTTVAEAEASKVDFGEVVDVTLDVDGEDGFSPTEGTSTLYARKATSSTWEAVATNSSASLDFLDVRPRMTTTYKVVYNGHEADATSGDDSYARSESAPFTVEVARTITRPRGGFEVSGRVRPRYAGRAIVVRVSAERRGGFTRFRKLRTDRRGRYSIVLPRRGGVWYWSFVVKADQSYAGTRFKWRTWVSPERAR
ncbi:hypothetical protein GCM10011376_27820 [Nocardioides flavus (ex Wang et al. 2016)]|uniref:Carboxypeptidase regulatory-like domain-containing protein n=1 Tax=Nocardioides flavus (ex Wang et al. 2016) TaxID=2058780 RepID=A0ABQ3HND0_9ACTN|nr:hypothetical protein [Nocardioides flavus (ex Wang et al. 2016)]GHE18172.1 hypothetical protein GCM10011376_27820 [Nocardioides flavus (ex Wang et al. 2016)]